MLNILWEGFILGFWSSLFGLGAAHAYNETKKEEKETQKWNDNLQISMNYEEGFSNYLKSIGSNAVYIAEVDKSVASVKNQIDSYKRKIKEFLNLGGEGKYIYDVEELDEYIEILKYLKSVDCLDRQEEFLGLDLLFAKDTIEREKEEQALQRENEIAEIIGMDINSLSGIEFEKVCQQLVESMGFETETTKASGDGGIDLIAYNHQPLLSGKYIIQCKRYSGSVGEPIIRDLYGVVTSERANKGILMTTGYFTKSAITFADGKPIELIDGGKIKYLLSQYNIAYNDNICKDYEKESNLSNDNKIYTIEEIFENNPIDIEDYYEKVNDLRLEYSDRKCADIIIYLVSNFAIMSFDEKLSIIPEINKYIFLYINEKKDNIKCKWLSFLFMMCYIQFSILSGMFDKAKNMADTLMQNRELLFDDAECVEAKYTLDICTKHIGMFWCLYSTLYNVVQLSDIVKDDELRECIYKKYHFDVIKFMARNEWEDSVKKMSYQHNNNTNIRKLHFESELEALYNIEEVNRIYLISEFELETYYNYVYKDMAIDSLFPGSYNMEIIRKFESINGETKCSDYFLSFEYNDGTDFGKLYNLTSKIENYNNTK